MTDFDLLKIMILATESDRLKLAIFVIIFAPFIAAYGLFRMNRGRAVWKVLSFVFCVLASIAFLGLGAEGVVLWWVIACIFAAVAIWEDIRSAADR